MLKKIFSHSLIYGLAPQIPKLATFVTLPFITVYLTEIDFGVFGIIIAIISGLSAISTLGLDVIIANVFYKHPNHFKQAWKQLYGFLILWNIVYSLIIAVSLFFLIPDEAISNRSIIVILNVMPVLIFGPTAIFGQTYFQYKEKPLSIAYRSIFFGLTSIIISTILIIEYKMGYMGWLIAISIATIGSNLSYWIPLNLQLKITPIFIFKWRYIKNSLKVSLPVLPHYYSNYLLNSSDQIIMKLMSVQTNDVGRYNVSYMFGNVIQQIGIACGKAISPMLYMHYKNKNEIGPRKIIFSLQSFFLLMTFSISIWLKELFSLLIKNESLSNMYILAIIIIMSYSYRPMYLGANNRLFYIEKTKVLLKISLGAGLANVLMNLIFIPIYGFEVAAITTYVSLMYMGYSGYYLKVFKDNNNLNYYPLLWLLTTLILTISAIYIVELDLVIKVLVNIILAFVFFVFIKKNQNYV